jgi:hypothetical protein
VSFAGWSSEYVSCAGESSGALVLLTTIEIVEPRLSSEGVAGVLPARAV